MAYGLAQGTRAGGVNLHAAARTRHDHRQPDQRPVGTRPSRRHLRAPGTPLYGPNAMLTDVDAPKPAEPLVKWRDEPARPQDAPHASSEGILLASAAPARPVNLSLPLDDWDQEADPLALGHLASRAVDGSLMVTVQSLSQLRDRLPPRRTRSWWPGRASTPRPDGAARSVLPRRALQVNLDRHPGSRR